jgi:2',3'-cyclic-nucleotide 2'-phosphodiesterase (5'-nucleotidase family)
VKQPSGKNVPVVQAFAFGKYLGNLMVTFSDEGEVIATAGLPIIMDKSIPQGTILFEGPNNSVFISPCTTIYRC